MESPAIKETDGGFEVSLTVTNRGETAGKEVVQVYVSAPSSEELKRPEKELRGFAKTSLLRPGESETVTICFDADDLASYSEALSAWVTEAGEYKAVIARSANEPVFELTFAVKERAERTCHDVLKPQHELHLIR